MPKQYTINKSDIVALFGGLTNIIAEYNPEYKNSFKNYQTLYCAFVQAQNEIAMLKQKLENLNKKIHN